MSLDPNIPIMHRSDAPTPSVAGSYFVFYDIDNNNNLTGKDSNCDYRVFAVDPILVDAMPITAYTAKVLEDAGCALRKGQMTAEQYESLVSNLNIYYNVMFDITTGSYTQSLSATPVLFVSLAITNVLCNGSSTGTAVATVTGGVAPYVETWDGVSPGTPGALAAGAHNVLITDATGSTIYRTFLVSEPTAVTGVLSSTPDSGGTDGTATVVAAGGVAPYTYLWDDGGAQTTATATGLAAGDYNVVVTDANGCVNPFGPVTVL